MSISSTRKLSRLQVGALPLIRSIMARMRLREILLQYIPCSSRQGLPRADLLVLLVANLTLAKDPLYELADWVGSLDLRALGYKPGSAGPLNDDCFARALDKLYEADRSSLLTRLVVSAIKAFDVRSERIHNDSTTVKACGRIPGLTRTGLELRHGHSKDHRPDLRQLVYSLSVSDDGAVPIHHHVYPGNRNDETTHIESWDALCQIHGGPEFLYVADCKLCTRKQLSHIVEHHGKAITVLPHNLVEVRRFHAQLRAGPLSKKLLWRRPKPNYPAITESFYLFDPTIEPKAVLQAYKFQARLEKRFCQFKSIHHAAPLLFKKIRRVEANMFAFFIALLIQALLERELRQKLDQHQAPPLKLYPEDRDAPHPTSSQLFKTFDRLSTYAITQERQLCEEYHDDLTQTHRAVLSLLDIQESAFWS